MNNLIKRFTENSVRLMHFTPFLLLLFNVLTLSALQAYPVDKGLHATGEPYSDLPPGSAPAIAMAMLKDLPVEYQLREEGRTFTMSNPAHDMEIDFTPDGIQVASGDRRWGMAMTGIGTPSSVKPVQKAVVQNDNGRMVYERGDVVEWYVNSPWGMEQGFTIQKAPGERSRDGLVVEISLSGDLLPSLDAKTLLLADAQGNSIARYTGLQVFDADGRSLPAHLTLAGSTLRILVDDAHAPYPVTIDPWIQKAKLTASDGAAGDMFGRSVAISSDMIVVGAAGTGLEPFGAAYVFAKPANGWANMTQIAKLTASDGAFGDGLGFSVAMSGDTIVVGAYSHSAYVFVRPESGWTDMTQTAKLTASDDGTEEELFGSSVAISGDTIVVGAQHDDDKGVYSGSVYVFSKPGSGWADMTQTAKITAGDGSPGDYFGESVAISGDTIVVGAWGDIYDRGSAYVFARPDSGSAFTQTAKLTASDGTGYEAFGDSVAISGDTIIVGAAYDDGKGYDSGSAYVFSKPGSGWSNMTQTAKLTASDETGYDAFGVSVAISGDTIVVGAYNYDVYHSFGSAYVFKLDAVTTEQWGLILDNGLGSANLTFFKKQDGTITADGNWKYLYQGSTNVGTFTGAPVTISGKSIALTATGTATNLSAPPGYTTSPYTAVFSGTAFDGEGSGTYTVTFQTYGWPDKLSGSWQGTRTSGSGITAVTPVKTKALPWLMLLLGD